MRITIRFQPGFEVEGVVVSAANDILRIAVSGWDDIAEFHLVGGQWFAESGEPVLLDWPAGVYEGVFTEVPAGLQGELPRSEWLN